MSKLQNYAKAGTQDIASTRRVMKTRPVIYLTKSMLLVYILSIFFYKNMFYKDTEAEICEILRIY